MSDPIEDLAINLREGRLIKNVFERLAEQQEETMQYMVRVTALEAPPDRAEDITITALAVFAISTVKSLAEKEPAILDAALKREQVTFTVLVQEEPK